MTLLLWLAMMSADAPAALLQTGTFHGDEVSASDGSTWMALIPSSGSYAWHKVKISVKTVIDPVSGLKDAKQVSIPGVAPLFMLSRQHSWMSGRPKQVVYQGPGMELDKPIRLGTQSLLRLDKNELIFQDFGIVQALYAWPDPPANEHRSLLWAGDLDGDGRTDLLLNVSEHYNVSRIRLYLSGKRTGKALLGLAAELFITGC